MKKILAILKYALLAISVIVVAIVMINGEASVDTILNWSYVLFGLAVVVTLFFPILNLAQNPKGALRSLIGLALLVVVVGVAYALAGTTPVPNSEGGFFTNTTELKVSDTGLITTYIALALAIIVVVAGEIRNSFK
ncbi:MAG: hypothetical protein LUF87_04750 [Alistipes sp.]|nr:hypothetical protein [Alistipes sp.]